MVGIGGDNISTFYSEKSEEVRKNQNPLDITIVERVKKVLGKKGIVLHQSVDADRHLIADGKEATTYSDGTIIMHTNVSASAFYEELIHYGQVKSGRAVVGDAENYYLMEIEAQERLIKYQNAYRITDYEIEILTGNLEFYKIQLAELRKG